MDRRIKTRRARRIGVYYWERGVDKRQVGYTVNISSTGMYVATHNPPAPGTRIRLQVGSGEHAFVIEAVVVRIVRSTQALASVRQAGMGVRFLQVEELVGDLIPEISSTAPATQLPSEGVYPLRFPDRQRFLEAYRRDMMTGGLFVPTSDPAQLNDVIEVAVSVDGAGGAPVRFRARVVHRIEPDLPGTSGGGANLIAGMGVELLEFDQTLAALKVLAGEG